MKRALLSILAAAALTAGLAAQDRPNFAGRWKAAGSFNAWTIAVDGNRMTVTMTVAGNSESTVYLLDGTPSTRTAEGPNGPFETVHTSMWEGAVLVTTITTPQMTRIERRSIEADGTMVVQTTVTMLQGKPVPPAPPGAGLAVFKRVGEAR